MEYFLGIKLLPRACLLVAFEAAVLDHYLHVLARQLYDIAKLAAVHDYFRISIPARCGDNAHVAHYLLERLLAVAGELIKSIRHHLVVAAFCFPRSDGSVS